MFLRSAVSRTARAAAVLAAFLLSPVAARAQEDFHHPELEWRSLETDHFFVHYHEGAERTARTVAKIAEEVYGPVTTLYDHEPDSKVSFVIKDYDDYSNGAAYFFDNKIEIWASSLDTDLRGTHNWLRNVITHEFTHVIQIQTSFKFGRRVPAIYLQFLGYESERRQDVLYGYPNTIVSYPLSGFVIPSWFAEGVAQFNRKELDYDYWDSHRDMILRSYVLDGTMLTWNEMSVFGKTSLGNESSYNAGFAFVSYIVDRFGDAKLQEISRNLSTLTEVTIDGAIERAVGIDGAELYRQWEEALKTDYNARTAAVRASPVQGEIIGGVGFANLYPSFSPDGKYLAYISNKGGDYFSSSSLYLYDLAAKTERKVIGSVRSNFSWSPDGRTIWYAKHTRDNPFWSSYTDIFSVDVASGDEHRVTEGLRANAPAVSPDGQRIAYVAGSDGTLNLFTMRTDGSDVRQLTSYANGEQVYNPAWYPDGSAIAFDYSIRDGRDILRVPAEGGVPGKVLATPDDERTGRFADGGRTLMFSSDRTGIFNVYRLDLASGSVEQVTNVTGGAFMPEVDGKGRVAYAQYTSSGYKLALMADAKPLASAAPYVRKGGPSEVGGGFPGLGVAPAAGSGGPGAPKGGPFDWQSLRNYDDTKLPAIKDTKYRNTVTSLSIIPFVRVDNYNPRNKGYEVIKPGAYIFSYDMLDRYGFFASAAMNAKAERDLFFTFDYNGRIPGFFQLGWDPGLSLQAYNVTRKTDSYVALPLDTIPVGISYNLLEFDVLFRQPVFDEALRVEYGYRHSRYTSDISSFYLPDAGVLVPAASILYFKGNDLFLETKLELSSPSRTQEISPLGTKLRVRYDYEFNAYDPTDQIDETGSLVHVFKDVNFHRIEMGLRQAYKLPGWNHTVTAGLRAGTIFGPPVDDFFDFYLGGLGGMRGYPFYSLGGNEFGAVNLTYRFPIWDRIDIRFLQFYFDKLYASVYTDAGTAWTGGPMKGRRFIHDAGFEVRLESFSFYAYPTRVFFSATYGFDRFDRYVGSVDEVVSYGAEWQYHFGILFGFDFD
jgi:Tol biopolymer transport system component